MKTEKLIKEFKKNKLGPYIEVPCSILRPIIEGLMRDTECEVINPVNEAIAMGLAAGSFLATKKIPVVLMQNSGLCNTLNAITSLNQIYKLPVLYIIAWRGQPSINDAPQHTIMGLKSEEILKTFDIPYEILLEESYKDQIETIIKRIKETNLPGALLLRRGFLDKSISKKKRKTKETGISRAEAVKTVISNADEKAFYVTTNGFISREAFDAISNNKQYVKNPAFYMLGSMGHALPLAIGIEKYLRSKKRVIVLDGDGGCLMHLGAMASVGQGRGAAKKLIHIVLDNGVYASTGNQPTVSGDVDFRKIARGCGYKNVHSVNRTSLLKQIIKKLLRNTSGPSFIHVRINDSGELPKSRVSSKYTCEEIKENFVKEIA